MFCRLSSMAVGVGSGCLVCKALPAANNNIHVPFQIGRLRPTWGQVGMWVESAKREQLTRVVFTNTFASV